MPANVSPQIKAVSIPSNKQGRFEDLTNYAVPAEVVGRSFVVRNACSGDVVDVGGEKEKVCVRITGYPLPGNTYTVKVLGCSYTYEVTLADLVMPGPNLSVSDAATQMRAKVLEELYKQMQVGVCETGDFVVKFSECSECLLTIESVAPGVPLMASATYGGPYLDEYQVAFITIVNGVGGDTIYPELISVGCAFPPPVGTLFGKLTGNKTNEAYAKEYAKQFEQTGASFSAVSFAKGDTVLGLVPLSPIIQPRCGEDLTLCMQGSGKYATSTTVYCSEETTLTLETLQANEYNLPRPVSGPGQVDFNVPEDAVYCASLYVVSEDLTRCQVQFTITDVGDTGYPGQNEEFLIRFATNPGIIFDDVDVNGLEVIVNNADTPEELAQEFVSAFNLNIQQWGIGLTTLSARYELTASGAQVTITAVRPEDVAECDDIGNVVIPARTNIEVGGDTTQKTLFFGGVSQLPTRVLDTTTSCHAFIPNLECDYHKKNTSIYDDCDNINPEAAQLKRRRDAVIALACSGREAEACELIREYNKFLKNGLGCGHC